MKNKCVGVTARYHVLIVILLIGMTIDALFSHADRAISRRWGLADA